MDSGSQAIAELYRLEGQAFEDRFRALAANVCRILLEGYARTAPAGDDEDVIVDLARAVHAGQKVLALGAGLTAEQQADFEGRMDDVVAGAIVDISRAERDFPDRSSVEFLAEAVKRLGIPAEEVGPGATPERGGL